MQKANLRRQKVGMGTDLSAEGRLLSDPGPQGRGAGFKGDNTDFIPPPKPKSHSHISDSFWAFTGDVSV